MTVCVPGGDTNRDGRVKTSNKLKQEFSSIGDKIERSDPQSTDLLS